MIKFGMSRIPLGNVQIVPYLVTYKKETPNYSCDLSDLYAPLCA